MFYFTAQTGVISREPSKAPSNFYQYTFADHELAWVKRQLARAEVGTGGFEYPPGVIQAFSKKDLRRPSGTCA